MQLETMIYESDGDIIRLTLNRPQVLNAIDYRAAVELHQAAQAILDDPTARVAVLRGRGRAFCTGIDLKELQAGATPPEYFEQWDLALRCLERADKLVLCAMQGYALGGGLQLPLACDIRIATPGCVIGLPAAKEGFIPGLGTYRLPRYIGLGRAKRMALSGETVDGVEAQRIGLVDYLGGPEEFDPASLNAVRNNGGINAATPGDEGDAGGGDAVEELVQHYRSISSEGARQTKLMLSAYQDLPYDEFMEEYLRRQQIAVASPDHQEAMAAWRERRPPEYRRRDAPPG